MEVERFCFVQITVGIYILRLVILDVLGRHIPSDIDWFMQQERGMGTDWPKSGYRSMLRSDSGKWPCPRGNFPGVGQRGYPAENPDQEEIGRVDPAQ